MEKCQLILHVDFFLSEGHLRGGKNTHKMSQKMQHANITLHILYVGLNKKKKIFWFKKNNYK